ncbi:MAG: diacylglycerol/lipid kinase family protein [Acidimicrobiia bacterium]
MRVLLLVNSTAASVTPSRRAGIRTILASRHNVEVAETSRRGHATLLARAAADDHFDVVAVFAGDGTLNEAAAGLLHSGTALAPLPGGSTNVYCQMLGFPRRSQHAARALVDSLDRESLRRVGVGTASERLFLSSAGIGFDASVIRRVERHSRRVKRLASHPLHVVAAFQTFWSADGRATHASVDVENGPLLSDVRFAIVSKSTPYTFLGRLPLNIARNANLDARLSLTAFTRLRAVTLIGGTASSIRSGRFLARRRDVVALDDVSTLRIYSDSPFPYQVDGDDAGDTNELDFSFVPESLLIVVP